MPFAGNSLWRSGTSDDEPRSSPEIAWGASHAIENARGYGLPLLRLLLAQSEELVDVPATLTSDGRRGSGQRGKTDQGDALAVARIALRDQDRLPRLDATELDDELKLLADTRDQLIVEAGRWHNRAHALLRVASPGYQPKTGALASAGSVRRARAIAKRSVAQDPVRGRLAVQALDCLTADEAMIAAPVMLIIETTTLRGTR